MAGRSIGLGVLVIALVAAGCGGGVATVTRTQAATARRDGACPAGSALPSGIDKWAGTWQTPPLPPRNVRETVTVRGDGSGEIDYHYAGAYVDFCGLHATGQGQAAAVVSVEAYLKQDGYAPTDRLTFKIVTDPNSGAGFQIANAANAATWSEVSPIFYRSA